MYMKSEEIMLYTRLQQALRANDIIPVVTDMDQYEKVLKNKAISSFMLKMGDIHTLPKIIKEAKRHNKFVMLHQDSVKGIAKDSPGIKFIAELGVDALITTKPQYVNAIKNAGMFSILCLFLIDTSALVSGLKSLKNPKPDAVIVMPMSIPKDFIDDIVEQTGVDIILGGLVSKAEDIEECRRKGAIGISVGKQDLWP